ncbi:MAG TPA: hypothetical protein VKB88_33840 [Bryobacteraceae bacterium]|nr:hypothetical protein [Bryobacteraceae bacterium]
MHGDMVSFIALYLVLWIALAGVMGIALIIYVFRMNPDNPAADTPGLGIPGDMIADFEAFFHFSFVIGNPKALDAIIRTTVRKGFAAPTSPGSGYAFAAPAAPGRPD